MIRGIKLGRLNPIEKNFVELFEFIMKGFKNVRDDILSIFEGQINMAEKVNSLEAKISELEEAINQLRTTLDKLSELR